MMKPPLALRYTVFPSRLGPMFIAMTDKGVASLHFPATPKVIAWVGRRFETDPVRDDKALAPVRKELEAYLDGNLKRFSCKVDLAIGTPFQRKVWQALLRIPYGETRTYADIAKAIGSPTAYRAVGGANHQNPIPLIVPCHRVIGKDGSMVGYGGPSAGGQAVKRELLVMEGALEG